MDANNTPLPVKRALKRLGQDLCNARKRRRIPMKLAAERAAISRMASAFEHKDLQKAMNFGL